METNVTTSAKNFKSNSPKDKNEAFNKSRWPSLKKNTKSKNNKKNELPKKNHNKNKTNSPRLQLDIPNKFTSNKSENNTTVQGIKSKLDKRPKEKKITDSDMFLISRDVIPPKLLKIVKVKEALKRGDALTVADALEEFDVDNKVYYKYRPLILPFYEATTEKIFTLVFSVEQEGNILTKIVTMISKHFGEIITLNKGFPVDRISTISVSFDTTNLDIDFDLLLSKLEQMNGVRSMEIMGRIHNTRLSKPGKINKTIKQSEAVKTNNFLEIDEFKKSDGFIKISESKEISNINKSDEINKSAVINESDNTYKASNFNNKFKNNNKFKKYKRFNKKLNPNKEFNKVNHSN